MEEESRPTLRSQRSPHLKDVKYSQSLDLDSLCSSNDSLATNSSDDRVVNVERKNSGGALRRNVSNSSNSSVTSNSPGPPLMRKRSSRKSLDGVVVERKNSDVGQNVPDVDVDAGYSTSTTDGSSINIELEALVTSSGVEMLTEQCNSLQEKRSESGVVKVTSGGDNLSDIMERSAEMLENESHSDEENKGKTGEVEEDSRKVISNDASITDSQESLSSDDVFQELSKSHESETETSIEKQGNKVKEILQNNDTGEETKHKKTLETFDKNNVLCSQETVQNVETSEKELENSSINGNSQIETSEQTESSQKVNETNEIIQLDNEQLNDIASENNTSAENEEKAEIVVKESLSEVDICEKNEDDKLENETDMFCESEEGDSLKMQNSASTDSIDMISQECEDILSTIPTSPKHIDGTWGYSYIRAKKAKKEAKLKNANTQGCNSDIQVVDINIDSVVSDPVCEISMQDNNESSESENDEQKGKDSAYDSLHDSVNVANTEKEVIDIETQESENENKEINEIDEKKKTGTDELTNAESNTRDVNTGTELEAS